MAHHGSQTEMLGLILRMDVVLAENYTIINELETAENLLNNCLAWSKNINDDFYTGITLQAYGRFHKQAQNWKAAIEYFDQILEISDKGSSFYLSALHDKICCMVGNHTFANAKKLLKSTGPLYRNNKFYSVLFESLGHFVAVSSRLSIYNDEATEFMETITIPHLKKTHDYFLAVDYYKLLEAYYELKNNKKSLLASKGIRDIYERCFIRQSYL